MTQTTDKRVCECGLSNADDCVSTPEYCAHPALRSASAASEELNWQRLVRLLRDPRCTNRHDLQADAASMIERLVKHVDSLTPLSHERRSLKDATLEELEQANALPSSIGEHPAERAIREHNLDCAQACGKTSDDKSIADSLRCDVRRDCPDCPRQWEIDYTPSARGTLPISKEVADEMYREYILTKHKNGAEAFTAAVKVWLRRSESGAKP